VQANSSDWSAQSGTPSHCLPSGTQLASDQHINSVCIHPDDDGCVLTVTTDDNLCSVLIVDVDVVVDGVLSPSSTNITLTTSHSPTQSLPVSTHRFLIFSYCLSTDWDNVTENVAPSSEYFHLGLLTTDYVFGDNELWKT